MGQTFVDGPFCCANIPEWFDTDHFKIRNPSHSLSKYPAIWVLGFSYLNEPPISYYIDPAWVVPWDTKHLEIRSKFACFGHSALIVCVVWSVEKIYQKFLESGESHFGKMDNAERLAAHNQ